MCLITINALVLSAFKLRVNAFEMFFLLLKHGCCDNYGSQWTVYERDYRQALLGKRWNIRPFHCLLASRYFHCLEIIEKLTHITCPEIIVKQIFWWCKRNPVPARCNHASLLISSIAMKIHEYWRWYKNNEGNLFRYSHSNYILLVIKHVETIRLVQICTPSISLSFDVINKLKKSAKLN